MTSVEWYTPKHIADRVRDILGGSIPLDPASCARANEVVRAEKYYTKEDNGLTLPWDVPWFCNPPFGRENHLWVEKAISAPTPGVLLVNGDPSSAWFRRLWQFPVAFLHKRTRFWGGDGKSPRHWQVLVGMRVNPGTFDAYMSDIAHIVHPRAVLPEIQLGPLYYVG